MTDKTHFSEDPQLTAYALGELAGEERAAVEAQLREHPERRAAVEEIKAAVARLEAALKAEPAPVAAAPANAPGHARAGEPRKHGGGVPVNGQYARPHGAKLLRFPQVYYVIGGLAAACFAVVVALHESPLQVAPRKAPPETSEQIVALPLELPAVGLAEPELAEAASPDPQPGADRASGASGLLAQVQAEQAERRRTEGRLTSMARADTGAEQAARDQAVRESIRTESYASTGRAAVLPGAGTRVRTQLCDIVSPQSRAPALTYSGAAAAPARSDTEAYAYRAESDFLSARENPLSTFSADVDTASYANVRRMIVAGTRPPVDAVRIEEMLNYFPYRYAAPAADRRADAATAPFAASLEVAAAPWAEGRRLVRIGLKGREVTTAQRSAANLVFLVDVSGSMNQPNKLPLVKESMRLLLGRLRADDRVAIVTYAGASGLALPSTPVAKAREIEASLEELAPAGSTNGAMGIHLAYDVAKANFVPGGVNRVILCTDGDFNVGVTSEG
ncbi:MAG TPA: von Willebrand factor type A domain-containing protein, partial [Opitutus sp.]|nr:von Willebrand factor type A domain-containing protein [Opitutus sp.]